MQLRGQVLTNCGKVSAGLAASQGCQASDLRATVSVVALQFLSEEYQNTAQGGCVMGVFA
jgi:hypothetical protein